MKTSKAIEFLKAHESPVPSRWREDALWRKENEFWLKYSRFITLKVLQAMEEKKVTQVQLAERMGCTQQYVSNLLKGSSNMTLETIAKLEKALEIDIIGSALTYLSGYGFMGTANTQYLNDPALPDCEDVEK